MEKHSGKSLTGPGVTVNFLVLGRYQRGLSLQEGLQTIQRLIPSFTIPKDQQRTGKVTIERYEVYWKKETDDTWLFTVMYPENSAEDDPHHTQWGQSTNWQVTTEAELMDGR